MELSDVDEALELLDLLIANRELVERSGTQEHEMYIPLSDNLELYTGEGLCGLLPSAVNEYLERLNGTQYPVVVPNSNTTGARWYTMWYAEGLNMYDLSAYGQARWEYVLRVRTLLNEYKQSRNLYMKLFNAVWAYIALWFNNKVLAANERKAQLERSLYWCNQDLKPQEVTVAPKPVDNPVDLGEATATFKPTDGYSVWLFIKLFTVRYDRWLDDVPYDVLYEFVYKYYLDFLDSPHNTDTTGLYDCITTYLKAYHDDELIVAVKELADRWDDGAIAYPVLAELISCSNDAYKGTVVRFDAPNYGTVVNSPNGGYYLGHTCNRWAQPSNKDVWRILK